MTNDFDITNSVGAVASVLGFDLLSLIALAAIVIIGLPHGAFDGAVALALGYGKDLKSMLVFMVSYLSIAALVVLFWLEFPELSLIIFLGISILHFGLGDSQPGSLVQRGIQIIAHGGTVVILISLLNWSEVELIFDKLIGEKSVFLQLIIVVSGYVMVGVLTSYFILAYLRPKLRVRLAELAVLAIAFGLLPPLVGFSLYFCGVHTPRHLARVWHAISEDGRGQTKVLTLALVFTLASWIAGGLSLWLVSAAETIDEAILRVVFIGLAALTVPHMILVDGMFRRIRKPVKV